MKKKMLAIMLSVGLVMSLAACGGSSDDSKKTDDSAKTEETQAPADDAAGTGDGADVADASSDDTADLQASLDTIANALNGTCWVGMNAADYTCYALGFDGNQVAFISNVDGDEGITGYWNISADALNFYEDEACTSALGQVAWSFDLDNEVMMLNDTITMAQVEGDMATAAEALEKEASAAKVGEYLNGTVWAGTDESASSVMAFTFKDGSYYIGLTDTTGEVATYTGTWAIDYDNIYLYDEAGQLFDTLNWGITEDGSELDVTVASSNTTCYLAQTDADNVEAAMTAIAETITAQ